MSDPRRQATKHRANNAEMRADRNPEGSKPRKEGSSAYDSPYEGDAASTRHDSGYGGLARGTNSSGKSMTSRKPISNGQKSVRGTKRPAQAMDLGSSDDGARKRNKHSTHQLQTLGTSEQQNTKAGADLPGHPTGGSAGRYDRAEGEPGTEAMFSGDDDASHISSLAQGEHDAWNTRKLVARPHQNVRRHNEQQRERSTRPTPISRAGQRDHTGTSSRDAERNGRLERFFSDTFDQPHTVLNRQPGPLHAQKKHGAGPDFPSRQREQASPVNNNSSRGLLPKEDKRQHNIRLGPSIFERKVQNPFREDSSDGGASVHGTALDSKKYEEFEGASDLFVRDDASQIGTAPTFRDHVTAGKDLPRPSTAKLKVLSQIAPEPNTSRRPAGGSFGADNQRGVRVFGNAPAGLQAESFEPRISERPLWPTSSQDGVQDRQSLQAMVEGAQEHNRAKTKTSTAVHSSMLHSSPTPSIEHQQSQQRFSHAETAAKQKDQKANHSSIAKTWMEPSVRQRQLENVQRMRTNAQDRAQSESSFRASDSDLGSNLSAWQTQGWQRENRLKAKAEEKRKRRAVLYENNGHLPPPPPENEASCLMPRPIATTSALKQGSSSSSVASRAESITLRSLTTPVPQDWTETELRAFEPDALDRKVWEWRTAKKFDWNMIAALARGTGHDCGARDLERLRRNHSMMQRRRDLRLDVGAAAFEHSKSAVANVDRSADLYHNDVLMDEDGGGCRGGGDADKLAITETQNDGGVDVLAPKAVMSMAQAEPQQRVLENGVMKASESVELSAASNNVSQLVAPASLEEKHEVSQDHRNDIGKANKGTEAEKHKHDELKKKLIETTKRNKELKQEVQALHAAQKHREMQEKDAKLQANRSILAKAAAARTANVARATKTGFVFSKQQDENDTNGNSGLRRDRARAPSSKDKQPVPTNELSVTNRNDGFPTHSGKKLPAEYLEAYLRHIEEASMPEDQTSDSPDPGPEQILDGDLTYFEYTLKRKEWPKFDDEPSDDDPAAVVVCARSHYLNAANALAVKEILRPSGNAGDIAIDPSALYNLSVGRDDNTDALWARLDVPSGSVKCWVERSLVSNYQGVMPQFEPAGFVQKRVWVVTHETWPTEDEVGGGEGREGGHAHERKHELGDVYTLRDLANKKASEAFLEATFLPASARLAEVAFQRSELARESAAKLEELERCGEVFDATGKGRRGGWVRVCVRERRLSGPRN